MFQDWFNKAEQKETAGLPAPSDLRSNNASLDVIFPVPITEFFPEGTFATKPPRPVKKLSEEGTDRVVEAKAEAEKSSRVNPVKQWANSLSALVPAPAPLSISLKIERPAQASPATPPAEEVVAAPSRFGTQNAVSRPYRAPIKTHNVGQLYRQASQPSVKQAAQTKASEGLKIYASQKRRAKAERLEQYQTDEACNALREQFLERLYQRLPRWVKVYQQMVTPETESPFKVERRASVQAASHKSSVKNLSKPAEEKTLPQPLTEKSDQQERPLLQTLDEPSFENQSVVLIEEAAQQGAVISDALPEAPLVVQEVAPESLPPQMSRVSHLIEQSLRIKAQLNAIQKEVAQRSSVEEVEPESHQEVLRQFSEAQARQSNQRLSQMSQQFGLTPLGVAEERQLRRERERAELLRQGREFQSAVAQMNAEINALRQPKPQLPQEMAEPAKNEVQTSVTSSPEAAKLIASAQAFGSAWKLRSKRLSRRSTPADKSPDSAENNPLNQTVLEANHPSLGALREGHQRLTSNINTLINQYQTITGETF